MDPNRIIARFLTDEDLLDQFRASDGVCERAQELLAEIEKRGLVDAALQQTPFS